MKEVYRFIFTALVVAWQLPQLLLGLLIALFVLPKTVSATTYRSARVAFVEIPFLNVSLGTFIFIYFGSETEPRLRHEYGHTLQSLILGPLYLLVIGLPSVLWNLYCRVKTTQDYYWFYTERWANALGGVEL